MSAPPLRGTYREDLRARAAYSEGAGIYRIIPRAVALPADAGDLAQLVRWAHDSGTALVPRGAGSAVTGSSVGEGVVVDLTALTPRRLDIDPKARQARTSANITLQELAVAARAHGLRLPPDPASAPWATCGGAFSTDAAGARSVRYGSMRRWAVGCAGVTADGETFRIAAGDVVGAAPAAFARFAPVGAQIQSQQGAIAARRSKTRKDTSGYALGAWLDDRDLTQLLAGSEGTLAFITEITWRLDPIPPARLALRVLLGSLDQLGPAVQALLPTLPSACELLDRTFLDVARRDPSLAVPEAEAVLLVEYEGDSNEGVEQQADEAERAIAHLGARVTRARAPAEAEHLRALRHAASPILATLPESTRSLQVVEDGCVPIERLADYIALLRRAADSRGIPIVLFGHAGDGHVHANILPDVTRASWQEPVASLLEEVTAGLLALGGTPSGEHGDGRIRAGMLDRVYGPDVAALMRATKVAFDPDGILNPGVILPAGAAAPLAHLKVGVDAAPIPHDIADALRKIERTGGYARSRLEIAGSHPERTP